MGYQQSSTFSLGRAKTDTVAIEKEVQSAVDEATLKDLYGNGACRATVLIPPSIQVLTRSSYLTIHGSISQ